SSTCRLCGNAVESMHHVFVDCRDFESWRMTAADELVNRTELKLIEAEIPPTVWPLTISQYYIGQIPSLNDLITREMIPDTIRRRKLTSHVASDWHTSSIRLAGRIFGSFQRTMA
ncbi:hypothetical protein C8J57DRAFT_977749, partial [Mycena rebaudengoi]